MSIYRKIWQDHHNQSIPEGWHIHHIDGDKSNNHPDNLMCVSPHVHWCIHFLQGDPIALRGKFVQGAAKAGTIAGRKNAGRIQNALWITNGKESRKVPKDEAIPDGWYKGRVTPWNKGVPKSEEYKKKVSESHNKVWTCPHCGKSGGRMILRWHFDYCRDREGGPLKEINTSNMGKYERTKENREKLSKIVTEYYKRRKSNE